MSEENGLVVILMEKPSELSFLGPETTLKGNRFYSGLLKGPDADFFKTYQNHIVLTINAPYAGESPNEYLLSRNYPSYMGINPLMIENVSKDAAAKAENVKEIKNIKIVGIDRDSTRTIEKTLGVGFQEELANVTVSGANLTGSRLNVGLTPSKTTTAVHTLGESNRKEIMFSV